MEKRGGVCHANKCSALKHPSSFPRCLLPSHAYLFLPGSHSIHLLPLFNYKDFSESTLLKILNTSITVDNAENFRSSVYSNPQHALEAKIILQLFDPLNTPQIPSFHSPIPHSSPFTKTPPPNSASNVPTLTETQMSPYLEEAINCTTSHPPFTPSKLIPYGNA